MPVADDDEAVTLRGDNQCFDAADRNEIEVASRCESVANDDHEGAWNSAPRREFDYVRAAVLDRVKAEELFLFVFVHHIIGEFRGNTLQGEARELFAVLVPIMATAMTTFAIVVSFEARAFVLHRGGTRVAVRRIFTVMKEVNAEQEKKRAVDVLLGARKKTEGTQVLPVFLIS